jgi:hypothetical protein
MLRHATREFGPWIRSLAPLLLFVLLAGCYLPVKFDAEIEIDRRGFYSLIFDGYLVKVPLYADLRQRKISPTQEKEKVEQIRSDLERDPSTTEVKYVRQGHFKLHWEKKGDILESKFVSFVRRNENMLTVMYVADSGLITIRATPIADSAAQQLADIGLGMEGALRVITDAKVVSHNATGEQPFKSKGPRFKMYTWQIRSLNDPTPKMSIALQ